MAVVALRQCGVTTFVSQACGIARCFLDFAGREMRRGEKGFKHKVIITDRVGQ